MVRRSLRTFLAIGWLASPSSRLEKAAGSVTPWRMLFADISTDLQHLNPCASGKKSSSLPVCMTLARCRYSIPKSTNCISTSLKQGLGKFVPRQQIQKLREAHPKWFVKQTLMGIPTRIHNVKRVKNHANKWLPRMLNIASLEMVADCNLIILPFVRGAYFEREILIVSNIKLD